MFNNCGHCSGHNNQGDIVKKMKGLSLVVALSLFLAAGSVQAEGWGGIRSYMGASYGLADVLDDDFSGSNDPDPDIMIFRAGVYLNDYLGIEVRGGGFLGIHDAGDVEINNLYEVYLKPEMPLSDTFSMNFVAGYGSIYYKDEYSVKTRHDGFSYGIGATWLVYHQVALTADFAKAADKSNFSVGTFVVGGSYYFGR